MAGRLCCMNAHKIVEQKQKDWISGKDSDVADKLIAGDFHAAKYAEYSSMKAIKASKNKQ